MILVSESSLYKIIGRYEVPGNPNLIRVLFEDGQEIMIHIRDWVDFELHINEPVEKQVYDSLVSRGAIVDALNLAKRYLRMRVKTSMQVASYLRGKGIDNDIIDNVMKQLKDDMIVDDEEYSSMFIASKKSLLSRKALAHKLEQRGIKQDIVQKAISNICDDESELHAAMKIAEKYLRHRNDIETQEGKHKMVAHLARKGFKQSTIYKIMNNLDGINE